MLLKVANDDIISYKTNNNWLIHHPNEALIFNNLENVWKELAPIFKNDFKELVYGQLPEETAVLDTLKMVRDRMKSIYWSIE